MESLFHIFSGKLQVESLLRNGAVYTSVYVYLGYLCVVFYVFCVCLFVILSLRNVFTILVLVCKQEIYTRFHFVHTIFIIVNYYDAMCLVYLVL